MDRESNQDDNETVESSLRATCPGYQRTGWVVSQQKGPTQMDGARQHKPHSGRAGYKRTMEFGALTGFAQMQVRLRLPTSLPGNVLLFSATGCPKAWGKESVDKGFSLSLPKSVFLLCTFQRDQALVANSRAPQSRTFIMAFSASLSPFPAP